MTTQKSILASKKRKYGYVYHFIFTRPTDGREFHYVGQHVGEKVDQRYFGSGFRLRQLQESRLVTLRNSCVNLQRWILSLPSKVRTVNKCIPSVNNFNHTNVF